MNADLKAMLVFIAVSWAALAGGRSAGTQLNLFDRPAECLGFLAFPLFIALIARNHWKQKEKLVQEQQQRAKPQEPKA